MWMPNSLSWLAICGLNSGWKALRSRSTVWGSPPNAKRTAKRLGMRTVLVGGGLRTPAYVDLRIPNILALRRQLGRLQVR